MTPSPADSAVAIARVVTGRGSDLGVDPAIFASVGEALVRATGYGLLLFRDDPADLHYNATAARLLDGGPIRITADGLEMEPSIRTRVERELARAAGEPGRRPIIVTASDGEWSKLLIIEDRTRTGSWTLIWVADFSSAPINCDWLAKAFDLTPAEQAVVSRLAAGESAERIAAALGNAVATIRSHLFRIYDKTQTTSQGQLIRLAHRAPMAR